MAQTSERKRAYRKLERVKASERRGRIIREAAKREERHKNGEKIGRWPEGYTPKEKMVYSRLKWEDKEHVRNPEKRMLRAAKGRARREGLPFSLVISDIVIPTYCPVLGIELKLSKRDGPKDSWHSSPSLDKIVPALGYVKGNIVVVSMRANRIKCDATPEELYKVAMYYRDNWGAR